MRYSSRYVQIGVVWSVANIVYKLKFTYIVKVGKFQVTSHEFNTEKCEMPKNFVVLVRERTIPTKRQPLVGEVSARVACSAFAF
jgi:hypothetical protein